MKERVENILNSVPIEGIDTSAPNNYTEVKNLVIQKELQQEVDVLKTMVADDPELFKELFKQRCIVRENDMKSTISFLVAPNNLCNKLYWDIAQELFAPQTLQEMLSIILPSTNCLLKADVNYETKQGIVGRRQYTPIASLELHDNLNELKGIPDFEELSHYVFSNNVIFNAETIKIFPLDALSSLKDKITDNYPDVAKKLFNHNTSLQTLVPDINTLNDKGMTPKAAIEQLIQGLTLGGESMTGNIFASKIAIEAVGRFSEYYDKLPVKTKEELRNLEADGISIGKIIDEEISQAKCVETTSSHLSKILRQNSDSHILTSPPEMIPSDLKALRDKYGPKHPLSTQKDDSLSFVLPTELANEFIKRIKTKTVDDLVSLISNFPSSFYNDLWQHIEIKKPTEVFNTLNELLNEGYFNSEQKQYLAAAIIKNKNRFELNKGFKAIFKWALTEAENSPEIHIQQLAKDERMVQELFSLLYKEHRKPEKCFKAVQEVLNQLDNDKKLEFLKKTDKQGNTLLIFAGINPSLLKYLLNIYPQNQQLDAVKKANHSGLTVLHVAASNFESLNMILGLYPEEQQFDAVNADDNGFIALHAAAENIQCLEMLLKMYPTKEQAFNAIKSQNSQTKQNLMHLICRDPKSTELVLKYIPASEIIELVTIPDFESHKVLVSADLTSFNLILDAIPKEHRIKAFQSLRGSSIKFDDLTRDPESFVELLNKFPKEVWIDVFRELYQGEYTNHLLMFAEKHPEHFKKILELLPEQTRLDILKITNRNKQFFWEKLTNIESIKAILKAFPEQSRLGVINSTRDEYGVNAALSRNFETLKAIIEVLPSDQKIDVLSSSNGWDKEPLLLKYDILEMLKLVPKDKWIDMLLMKKNEYQLVIESIAEYKQEKLYAILTELSDAQKIKLLKVTNRYENSVLYLLVGKTKQKRDENKAKENLLALTNFLKSLPEDIRIDLIMSPSVFYEKHAFNILQTTVRTNFEAFKAIMEILPDDKKLDALKTKDHRGDTVLHRAVNKSKCFKYVLDLYPEEEKVQAIMLPNEDGNTVLDYVSDDREESYFIVSPLLTEEQKKSCETKLLETSLNFCMKRDSLDNFIRFYEKADGHKAINNFLSTARDGNAIKILGWLADKNHVISSYYFDNFCEKNAENFNNNEFKSLLNKYIDYSFKKKDWDYIGAITSIAPHLIKEKRELTEQGIRVLVDSYEKIEQMHVASNNPKEANELKVLSDLIITKVKGYIAGNKDCDAFMQNAVDAKEQLEQLLGNKNINTSEIISGLKEHLLKGQVSPQSSYGWFSKGKTTTSTTDNKQNKKDDDDDLDPGLGSGKSCIIS